MYVVGSYFNSFYFSPMKAGSLINKPSGGFEEGLKSFDLFGERVQFTFENKRTFTTKMGGCISLISIFAMLVFITLRTLKLVTKNDPIVMSTDQIESNAIDLWDLGFMFAIEDVPP